MSASARIFGSASPAASVRAARGPKRAPGPSGYPLLGSALDVDRQGILTFFIRAHRQYGDLVRFNVGPIAGHLVVAPAHIEQILGPRRESYVKGRSWDTMRLLTGNGLLTSEGAHWQRQRRLLQPFFTTKAVAAYSQEMIAVAAEVATSWEAAAAHARPIEIHSEMMNLALDVLGRTLFGVRFSDQARPIGEAVYAGMQFVAQRTRMLLPPPLWLPTPGNRRFLNAKRLLTRFILDRICNLSAEKGGAPAMLTALREARDPETGAGMSQQELIDELITFVIAGHETSAVALTWTFSLLGRNPAVEERLHAELDTVLSGRLPTLSDIPALVYTRQVIEEALRLYPTAWIFPRTCAQDEELSGYRIPRGSMILVCPYLTHRLECHWPEPERFLPERFSAESARTRPRHAYLPFSAGLHTCIGQHFSMQELILSLATLAQRFHLQLHSSDPPPIDAESTLRPGAPIFATPKRRTCSSRLAGLSPLANSIPK